MFEGQPKGLYALALANTGERFGYYTMLAIFTLFMQAKFGWTESTAGTVNAVFLAAVYFMPLLGGIVADKIGYGKCVTIGFITMFLGYLGLAVPTANDMNGQIAMFAGLACVSIGTGFFKGNLQVLVGNLYDDPKYSARRDDAFSLFYMAINIGSMFAPSMAKWITNWHLSKYDMVYDAANHSPEYLQALYEGYGLCFGVACASVVLSAAIYYCTRKLYKHADVTAKQAKETSAPVEELTPKQTKDRITALLLVFAVVIFFWMAFHQNGATLTYFARDYVATTATGITAMEFDVTNLLLCIVIVYGLFGICQSKAAQQKAIWGAAILAAAGILYYKYTLTGEVGVSAPIFQQFNPCFVVALTPVSIALFGWLAKKGKEPKAPVKIGLGMLVAAVAYLLMTVTSIGLPAPNAETPEHLANVSPNILVSTYLILTFAELLLSPIGISFVTKVAPPKYKGMMMGGWFVATAVGNFLVSIPTILWGKDLYIVWGTLMCICLVAALFIFSIIKKLNRVA